MGQASASLSATRLVRPVKIPQLQAASLARPAPSFRHPLGQDSVSLAPLIALPAIRPHLLPALPVPQTTSFLLRLDQASVNRSATRLVRHAKIRQPQAASLAKQAPSSRPLLDLDSVSPAHRTVWPATRLQPPPVHHVLQTTSSRL